MHVVSEACVSLVYRLFYTLVLCSPRLCAEKKDMGYESTYKGESSLFAESLRRETDFLDCVFENSVIFLGV